LLLSPSSSLGGRPEAKLQVEGRSQVIAGKVKVTENERRERQLEDPAEGTMTDGYHTFEELNRINKQLLFMGKEGTKVGFEIRQSS
jgi:hypothetical protein